MSFKNINNLIASYFIVNGRDEILSWSIVFVLMILFMTLTNVSFLIPFVLCIILVVVVPGRLIPMNIQARRSNYLMIPANYKEKMTANLILLYLYYFIGSLIVFFLSYCLAFLLAKYVFKFYAGGFSNFILVHSNLSSVSTAECMKSFVTILLLINVFVSTSIFSSVYFKKHPVGKMILCLFILLVFFVCWEFLITWLNAKVFSPHYDLISGYDLPYTFSTPRWLMNVIFLVISIYFYFLSFLRLKETEA